MHFNPFTDGINLIAITAWVDDFKIETRVNTMISYQGFNNTLALQLYNAPRSTSRYYSNVNKAYAMLTRTEEIEVLAVKLKSQVEEGQNIIFQGTYWPHK